MFQPRWPDLGDMTAATEKQYVKDVVQFSSQYGGEQTRSYAASNLVGPENNYPQYGDFTQALVLRTYGPWWKIAPSGSEPFKRYLPSLPFISEDFVEIVFEKAVCPTKIEVIETYNPGAVVRILALQEDDGRSPFPGRKRWVTLWSGCAQKVASAKARRFAPSLVTMKYPTKTLRLEFNSQHLGYYTELDAVVLHGNPAAKHHGQKSVVSGKAGARKERYAGQVEGLMVSLLRKLSLGPSNSDGGTQEGSNGYFDILPSELIFSIFKYLTLIELAKAAATCRLFFRFCYDPLWYKELNLMPHWTTVNDDTLDSFRSRCRETEKLDLSWTGCHDVISSDAVRRFFVDCGRNLVCLRLRSCNFVKKDLLCDIVLCCPQLEELDIGSCLEATSANTAVTGLNLHTLEKLKRLNLYRTTVDDGVVKAVARSCPALQHLNIGGCSQISECDGIIKELAEYCSSLVSLDLWRCRTLTSEGVLYIAKGCPLLEELDIGWCPNVNSRDCCIVHLAQNCTKLKKLFCTAVRSVRDDDVLAVAANCPLMEQLDILGTTLVHQQAITTLLKSCRHLKFLDVSFCSQLGQTLIQDLSRDYPNVSIKRSFITTDNLAL